MNKFANILNKYNYKLHAGDIVAGTIIHKEYSGFLVNIGNNIASYLPQEEIGLLFNYKNHDYSYLINTTREFFLITKNTESKQSILSIKRLEYIRGWKRIKQLITEDIIFNLKINSVNKGGIITYLEGIQGFIPKSHIHLKIYKKQKLYKKKYNIKCRLLVINDIKNQLIFSNKSAILLLSIHKFKLGGLLYGKITSIKKYGLFIKIYNIIALLHISEIGCTYINNINSYFSIGKLIKVKIIHINLKQGRLSVSRRNIKYKDQIIYN
uniref:Ribosomal protein S1 n=1 Tax=Sonderella linearis TaxID=110477 RepID=A0A1Z1MMV0_9FLOR|nr:ribosomal protein S1 [Sonderella linearis]ARW67125.1 ribosomal protein S1 [Sonderella linearis]